MQEITPREAAALLKAKPADTILLDVREPMELELAAVQGALHISMGEIPARLDEIDKSKTVICLCHSGGRSAQVAAFLEHRGYAAVVNLVGGIHGWSLEVDDSIPIY
jgi:rhodanese-related sulfurtransferase